MATLTPGKPFAQAQPVLTVDNAFTPGKRVFRLVVVDESGNESAPADIVVQIVAPAPPPVRPTPTPTPPIKPVIEETIIIPPGQGVLKPIIIKPK